MGTKIRSLALVVLAMAATVLMAFSPTVMPQVALLATTALIMGGAGHPLGTPPDSLDFVTNYRDNRITNYVAPALGAQPDKTVVVITPEASILGFGFDPAFTFKGLSDGPYDPAVATGQQNLDKCIHSAPDCALNQQASTGVPAVGDSFIVYGYSQSSTIGTLEKRALMQQYPGGGADSNGNPSPDVSFLLSANGNRPNGGILARGPEGLTIPIIGLTFSGPTPTDSIYQTIDISRQYDGWSDQPTNPLNLLAEVNVLFGMIYLHQNYDEVTLGQGIEQDQVGDTTYYLVPTPILPLLLPLDGVPVVGHPLADTLDPVLRVLVEAGYDRTISPGTPTNWNPLYAPNPVDLVHNLAEAVPTGLDNGIQDLTGDRPLATDRPGPYGVGGPQVDVNQQLSTQQSSAGGAEDLSAPDPNPSLPERPILTTLQSAATRVQTQGEVHENPLAVRRRGLVLLDGGASSSAHGVTNPSSAAGGAGGAPIKQLSQAVKAAVQNVIKPKPATSDGGE